MFSWSLKAFQKVPTIFILKNPRHFHLHLIPAIRSPEAPLLAFHNQSFEKSRKDAHDNFPVSDEGAVVNDENALIMTTVTFAVQEEALVELESLPNGSHRKKQKPDPKHVKSAVKELIVKRIVDLDRRVPERCFTHVVLHRTEQHSISRLFHRGGGNVASVSWGLYIKRVWRPCSKKFRH